MSAHFLGLLSSQQVSGLCSGLCRGGLRKAECPPRGGQAGCSGHPSWARGEAGEGRQNPGGCESRLWASAPGGQLAPPWTLSTQPCHKAPRSRPWINHPTAFTILLGTGRRQLPLRIKGRSVLLSCPWAPLTSRLPPLLPKGGAQGSWAGATALPRPAALLPWHPPPSTQTQPGTGSSFLPAPEPPAFLSPSSVQERSVPIPAPHSHPTQGLEEEAKPGHAHEGGAGWALALPSAPAD